MTKHTDKYGREWRYQPAHDTDKMVRIPRDVMERFILADRILAGHPLAMGGAFRGYLAAYPDAECYVLRTPLEICTGARFSDQGQDYLSSLIFDKAVLIRMLQYMRTREADMQNLQALSDLFPRLGINSLDL
jgi:hypothetical protein